MQPSEATLYSRLIASIRLRHVQFVLLTAELGSTHKASEAAGISQPSVAKYLSAVESLIGAPLFERHARGMRPTPIGAALLPFFQASLKLFERGAKAVSDVRSGAAGSLHIGATPAAMHGRIVECLAQFSELHPQYELYLEESTLALLKEGRRQGCTMRSS
ncbi:hypothetical protein AWV80_29850 [Cupriavidus sp. UYMU48A]|nr:hypothetical protein AWV80_29850 [Cupriavidus sp. UYMU48A]